MWVHYETDTGPLELELNGRETRAIALCFNYQTHPQPAIRHRLEFHIRHVEQLRLGTDEKGRRVVLLHFRLLPYCFHPEEATPSSPLQGFNTLFTSMMMKLDVAETNADVRSSPIYDDFFWGNVVMTTNRSCSSTCDWTSTVDPSGGSTFSRYRTYRMVLASPVHSTADNDLLQYFRDFALTSTLDRHLHTSRTRRHATYGFTDPRDDWCGGFPDAFNGLAPSSKYLLHAVFAETLLMVPNGTAATTLGLRLHRAGETVVNQMLTRLLSRTLATSWKRVIQWLDQHHQAQCDMKSDPELFVANEEDSHHGSSSDEEEEEKKMTPPLTTRLNSHAIDSPSTKNHDLLVQRVLITPLRLCPQLPSVEQSNRILRHFHFNW